MATAEWQVDGESGSAEVLVVDAGTALTAADRAQIDIQVATAKRYPRDIVKSQREAMALATADEEIAGSMFYAIPRKDASGKRVHIEGPSVRFAETLVYSWGNIRAEARIVAIDDTHVTAQGTCIDLEKNVGARVEVKRRITGSTGKRFNEDMIVTTGNAACSIAYRNAVFKVIPGALAKKIFDAAKRMATGGAQPIEARRQRALAWFARVGAPEERVLDLIGVASVNEITEEHLVMLTGLRNAIAEGDTTVEQAFNGRGAQGPSEGTADLNAALKQQPKQEAAAATPAARAADAPEAGSATPAADEPDVCPSCGEYPDKCACPSPAEPEAASERASPRKGRKAAEPAGDDASF